MLLTPYQKMENLPLCKKSFKWFRTKHSGVLCACPILRIIEKREERTKSRNRIYTDTEEHPWGTVNRPKGCLRLPSSLCMGGP